MTTANATIQPPADIRKLPFFVLGTTVVTAMALVGVLLLVNDPTWWRGFAAALVISLLAAAASLPPLVIGLRHGLHQAVAGYFLAAGVRLSVSLGGGLLAVKKGHYPATPTMLLMVVFYFALLAVETTQLAKALWSAKA